MSQRVNQAGLEIIKRCEGCRLEAYPDPATGGVPWTIGYGHAVDVRPGMCVTQPQAIDILRGDIARFEAAVAHALRTPLNDNQFSALVCFAFNAKGWRESSLLAHINAGNFAAAAQEWPKWVHAGGKVLPGLVERRRLELELFMKT